MHSNSLRPVEQAVDSDLAELVRSERDSALLESMSKRDADPNLADAAFVEFYGRHARYVWGICRRVCEGLNGETWLEDIHQDAFSQAYTKAGNFRVAFGTEPQKETVLVRAWLGKIAANMLRNLLRNHHREFLQDEDSWDKIVNELGRSRLESDQDTREFRHERKLIEEALDSLSERERLVLIRTFQYYRDGERFQRLPNKVSQELADQLATTPENLRKIRERALAKIQNFVTEHVEELTEIPLNHEKE